MIDANDLNIEPIKGKYQFKKRSAALSSHNIIKQGKLSEVNQWIIDNQKDISNLVVLLDKYAPCIKDGVTHLIIYKP